MCSSLWWIPLRELFAYGNGSRTCQLEFFVAFAVTFQHFPVAQITIENCDGKSDGYWLMLQMNSPLNTIDYCSKRMRQFYASYGNEVTGPFGWNGDHNRKFQKTMVKNWVKERFMTLRTISASLLSCLLAATIILFADIKSCLYEKKTLSIPFKFVGEQQTLSLTFQ